MEINISKLEIGKIKDVDFIAVLANLLDNAIEECIRIKGEIIKLKCNVYANNLLISVGNSTDKVQVNEKKMRTQKKDNFAHGVGLDIVSEIVDKYQGTFEIGINDGFFEVVVGLGID